MAASSDEGKDVVSSKRMHDEIKDDLNPNLAIITEYEEMFKGRYTDEDEAYVEAVQKRHLSAPPLVHPWYNRPKRNFDYRQGKGKYWTNNQRPRRRDYGRNRQYDNSNFEEQGPRRRDQQT